MGAPKKQQQGEGRKSSSGPQQQDEPRRPAPIPAETPFYNRPRRRTGRRLTAFFDDALLGGLTRLLGRFLLGRFLLGRLLLGCFLLFGRLLFRRLLLFLFLGGHRRPLRQQVHRFGKAQFFGRFAFGKRR